MPPGKDVAAYLSEYVHDVGHAQEVDSEIQALALKTWNALRRTIKAGPRRTVPLQTEVEALLAGHKLTTSAYFLDDTFEEVTYDISTTVTEVVEVRHFMVSEELLYRVFFLHILGFMP